MLELLGGIGSIVLVDLVLSGDNALVIGAAAAGLPRRERWLAIVGGGAGAVVLRILFAIAVTLLLQLPLLQAAGGVILLVIAIRLLMGREASKEEAQAAGAVAPSGQSAKRSFLAAMLTILVADVTMSLDNVLAVGALAAGHIPLLIGGLLLSVALLLVGSALVAALIGKLPWLLDLAALVLGWTAAHMILNDLRLGPYLQGLPWSEVALTVAAMGLVLVADLVLRWRATNRHSVG
jgi:YjbE family integral membrane protein